jgi:hypothetical protein
MAAQRYRNTLFNYTSLVLSTNEMNAISDYFECMQKRIEQANYTEIIDLKNYSIARNPNQIKKMLRQQNDTPFVFLMILN